MTKVKAKVSKVENKKNINKNSSFLDWAFGGIGLCVLSVGTIWSFVLTSRLSNESVTVQGMLVIGGILVTAYSLNSVIRLIRK